LLHKICMGKNIAANVFSKLFQAQLRITTKVFRRFASAKHLARDLPCKASDKAKCAEGQARVAKQARSAAEAPEVRRRTAILE
ncbi:hypothetical protein, partial [Leptospira sp. id769339]|uniref:hypothetical protein n=1 Tax=Leptospira sp. id769339 TaxID=2864221 RepID=UPI00214B86B9